MLICKVSFDSELTCKSHASENLTFEECIAMNPSVTIQTNRGPISLELFPSQAPVSVSNFLLYAFDDFYDGVLFHRVVANFVIQAGRFDSSGASKVAMQRSPIEPEPVTQTPPPLSSTST
jgi:hypothetical protein